MGHPNPQGIWTLVRVWLAGTALALAPLLLLEDMDFLFREIFFPQSFGPIGQRFPSALR
jgi:hypothetical protein